MYLKAREVREKLRGKVDPAVSECIEALAEQQSVYRQQLMEMAALVDQISDIVTQVVEVAGNMKSASEMLSRTNPDDDLPPVNN